MTYVMGLNQATKTSRGKLPLSVMAVIICVVVLAAVMYTEDFTALTHVTFLDLSTCARQEVAPKDREAAAGDGDHEDDQEGDELMEEEKAVCDPREDNVMKGKWVFNTSIKLPYSDRTCPYLDKQVSCVANGRLDSDYRHWQWQPDECRLARFDAEFALEKLRGKRLMFVGDSLQRGQWQSFVCLIESFIPSGRKSMKRGRAHSIFKAKEYNATVEFYWAPFLVESNSDLHIIPDPAQRILRVDTVEKHSKNWMGVDILVFNTYVWWMSGLRIKSLWGSFANGEEGYEELEAPTAYLIGLKTWANWVDSNINPNKTQVFFTTMSPTHMRSSDWHHKNGIRCYNETMPVLNKGYWGSGSDPRMMKVVVGVVERMKVPVSFINITQLSEHRIDGHASVYTESHGKILTDEQKADPKTYADCIHWCLPGVPDTWNQLFYAFL